MQGVVQGEIEVRFAYSQYALALIIVTSYTMAAVINEQSLLIGAAMLQIQTNGYSVIAYPATGENCALITHLTLINIDATKWFLRGPNDESNRNNQFQSKVQCGRDSNKVELKWNGEAYICGNCKQVLHPVPSKHESDLEKQLKIQRIQQQIEMEDLQHKQRMKELRTLLHA